MIPFKKIISNIFNVKEPPYLLIILISVFVWIFNSWTNNISSEPRVIYHARHKNVNSKQLFYYKIINVSQVNFEDLNFSIGFTNKDSLTLIKGNVSLEPPYYQQNISADIESGEWANFKIKSLPPKSKCNLIIEYNCKSDFIPKLKYESKEGDKPIILMKMNIINYILLHNNSISIFLLFLTLIITFYYFIWYAIKGNN